MKNEEFGLLLEENIKKLVQENFGWKKANIERKFTYREIKIGNNVKIITPQIN